jgi:hypothetical protein
MARTADKKFAAAGIDVSAYRTRMRDGEPVVVGTYGELYIYGDSQLGVYVNRTDRQQAVGKQFDDLTAQFGQPIQRGDWEAVWVLPADRVGEAARAIKAHKRRVLSPERRTQALQALAIAAQKAQITV